MIFRSRVVFSLFVLIASFAFAQAPQTAPQTSEDKRVKTPSTGKPAKPAAAKATQPQPASSSALVDEKLFGAMRWRQVGPFRGGRALAVTGVPGEPNVFYFGAASGGVWRSTDAGANWQPIFDQENIASIGSIAVAPSDHNIIYVGSGEACIRGNISYGNG